MICVVGGLDGLEIRFAVAVRVRGTVQSDGHRDTLDHADDNALFAARRKEVRQAAVDVCGALHDRRGDEEGPQSVKTRTGQDLQPDRGFR